MQVPLLTDFKRLEKEQQRFLMFVAINVVSWQNIIGPVMILFGRKIQMPESLIGLLLSFMPFTSLLLLFTLPMLIRIGPKRVMMTAWFLRNIITCLVFLMPLALASQVKWLSWAVLLVSILGFCVMRALGAGGWLPWLHEIVPTEKRSTYFSTETAMTQLINVAVLFLQARLLAGNPDIPRFLLIYGIGIAMGIVSLITMGRIPGGEGTVEINALTGMSAYKKAACDPVFRRFLLISTFAFSGLVWFSASYVLYLRDVIGLTDSLNMTLTACSGLGILLTIGPWGRFTDKNGSGLAMAKTMFAHSFAPLILLFLLPGMKGGTAAALAAVVLAGVFNAPFNVAANRAMLNLVPDESRIGYTSLWTICTALALGITPLAAGFLIEHFGLLGFRLCFILSGLFSFVASLLCLLFIHGKAGDRSWLHALVYTVSLPMLGKIFWITLGLDKSNRKEETEN